MALKCQTELSYKLFLWFLFETYNQLSIHPIYNHAMVFPYFRIPFFPWNIRAYVLCSAIASVFVIRRANQRNSCCLIIPQDQPFFHYSISFMAAPQHIIRRNITPHWGGSSTKPYPKQNAWLYVDFIEDTPKPRRVCIWLTKTSKPHSARGFGFTTDMK